MPAGVAFSGRVSGVSLRHPLGCSCSHLVGADSGARPGSRWLPSPGAHGLALWDDVGSYGPLIDDAAWTTTVE